MRSKVVLLLCAALVAVFSASRPGLAADRETEGARQHYLKGNQFFDVGRWDDAAEEYEKAYAIKNDPSLLYNMAQSYRRKGDAKRAIDLYKNYLIKAPRSPQRAEVEERIRVLQKQLDDSDGLKATGAGPASPAPIEPAAQPAPTPAAGVLPPSTPIATPPAAPAPSATLFGPPPASPSPPYEPAAAVAYPPPDAAGMTYPQAPYGAPAPYGTPSAPYPVTTSNARAETAPAPTSPGRGLRIGGVICAAAGAAGVGAGIIFGTLAKSYSDSVQSGAVFNPAFDERGKLYEKLQWVGYGVGAGLIAAGAVLYTVGAVASSRANKVAVVPTALPGGGGLSAGGTF